MTAVKPQTFKIGKWVVEPSLGTITADGEVSSIRPREMDLLVYLARNHGGIVTTDDIINSVWAGVAVTNDSLYFSMSQLRKALDGEDDEGSIIETLPKRGYRLMVPVEFIEDLPADVEPIAAADTVQTIENRPARSNRKSPLVFGRLIVAAVIVIAVAAMWIRQNATGPDVTVQQASSNSIAVMPFVDLTPETDYTYFSDGITEEILNRLTRVQGLRVAARTSSFSFKYKESDIIEIGDALGVTSILEGSVRKEGDRVRISAQLIDATSGFQIWSNTYERELSSVFAIQNEISRRIIDALQLTLASALPTSGETEERAMNPLAIDEYLMGLEEHRTYSFESLRLAEDHFATALEFEPTFPQARVQLAATKLSILNTGASFEDSLVDEAESLVRDVLDEDPQNAAAHRVLAQALMRRRDFQEGEIALNNALTLAPSDSEALILKANVAMHRGDTEEALQLLGRAVRIDPFGATVLQNYGSAQQMVGEFDSARETFSRAVDLHPDNPNTSWMLGKLQVGYLGEIAGGLHSFLASAEVDKNDYEIAAYVGMTYLSLEMPKAAEPWMRKAIAGGPDTITSRALETVYLMLTGHEESARELATDTLRDRPNRFGAHGMLSDSLVTIAVRQLLDNGKAGEAIDFLLAMETGRQEDSEPKAEGHEENSTMAMQDSPRRLLVTLAFAYQAAGRPDDAAKTLEQLADARIGTIGDRREHLRNDDYLIEAEALAVEGDIEGTLGMLETAVDANLYFNWQIRIAQNYVFNNIQSEPRYIALLDKVKTKIRDERLSVVGPAQLAALPPIKTVL